MLMSKCNSDIMEFPVLKLVKLTVLFLHRYLVTWRNKATQVKSPNLAQWKILVTAT